jgi:hypothetical protein
MILYIYIEPFLASNRNIFLDFKVNMATYLFDSYKRLLLELLAIDEVIKKLQEISI